MTMLRVGCMRSGSNGNGAAAAGGGLVHRQDDFNRGAARRAVGLGVAIGGPRVENLLQVSGEEIRRFRGRLERLFILRPRVAELELLERALDDGGAVVPADLDPRRP